MINHAQEWLSRIKGIKAWCVSRRWGELGLKATGLVQKMTTVRLQHHMYVLYVQTYVQYLGGPVLYKHYMLQLKNNFAKGVLITQNKKSSCF